MLLVLPINDLELVHLDVIGVWIVLRLVCSSLPTKRAFNSCSVCSGLLVLRCGCTLHLNQLNFKFDC